MKAKISNYQLASILAVCSLFSETTCYPYSYKYNMSWVPGMLLTAAAVLLLYFPHMAVTAKLKTSPYEFIAGKSRIAAWIFGLVIIARMFYAAVRITSELEFYVTNTIMPYFSFITLLITAFTAILYGLDKGIQAISRFAPIIVISFVALVIIFVITTREKTHFINLYSPFADGIFSKSNDMMSSVAKNDELFIYAVLCGMTREKDNTQGKSYKSILMYLPFVLFFSMFVYAFYVVILGRFLDKTAYPFYTIAGFTDSTAICADVSLGMVSGIIKLTIIFICVGIIIDGFFKKNGKNTQSTRNVTAGKVSSAVLAVASAVTAVPLISRNNLDGFNSSVFSLCAMGVTAIILPITALIIPKGGKSGEIPENSGGAAANTAA